MRYHFTSRPPATIRRQMSGTLSKFFASQKRPTESRDIPSSVAYRSEVLPPAYTSAPGAGYSPLFGPSAPAPGRRSESSRTYARTHRRWHHSPPTWQAPPSGRRSAPCSPCGSTPRISSPSPVPAQIMRRQKADGKIIGLVRNLRHRVQRVLVAVVSTVTDGFSLGYFRS